MPQAKTDDGVRLHYEETGAGTPVVFVHEFAGDCRSWEPQLRHFGQRYRCIAFNARGYPPSDVPETPDRLFASARRRRYRVGARSSAHRSGACRRSVHGRLRHAAFRPASRRARPLAHRRRLRLRRRAGATRDAFRAESEPRPPNSSSPRAWQSLPRNTRYGPSRVQFENKDPRGFAEFQRMLAEHSALGSANTQLGVQRERPSLYDLVEPMQRLTVPTLVVHGDEDWPCLLPGLLMKQIDPLGGAGGDAELRPRHQPRGARRLQPLVGDFFAQVDAGRWPMRDPRAVTTSITGMGR